MSDVEEVLHQQLSLMHSAKVNISAWYRAKHVCPRERLVYRLWQKHLGPPDGLQPRSQNQKTENEWMLLSLVSQSKRRLPPEYLRNLLPKDLEKSQRWVGGNVSAEPREYKL